MGGFVIDIFVEWLIRTVVYAIRRINSHSWPVVIATVSNARYESAGYGCDTTDLHFDYSFDGGDFSGMHMEPFIMSGSAKYFAAEYPAGTAIQVRVKPSQPEVTVALV